MESMRELHDLRSFVRVDTALDNSRAVRASASRMVVGVGVVDDAATACCCCVLVSAVIVADADADSDSAVLSLSSSLFLLPIFQALQ